MSDLSLLPADEAQTPRALALAGAGALLLSADGEVETITSRLALAALSQRPVLVCHTRMTASRLGVELLYALDILELIAFVRPARFCVPTPKGVALALDLPVPEDAESEALLLWQAQQQLLNELSDFNREQTLRAATIALQMQAGGWRWAKLVQDALGRPPVEQDTLRALASWEKLPDWQEIAPPPAQPTGIEAVEARRYLAELLTRAEHHEPRPQQSDYTSAVSAAFSLNGDVVLAEAGTGVGKTLGYLAPALLWAEQAQAPVWLSTYTRNLQRQIEQETKRIFPDEQERQRKVVIRKGRENYICLLNFDEAIRTSFATPQHLVALGLMARWIEATQDGDIKGGDLPGWLPDLVGRARTLMLADRRGECLHGACAHYQKCFIERAARKSRTAEIVIANHALVMSAAASGGIDEAHPPERFVFDEGHHIFHAADSAFGCDLTAQSGYELRRWILGGEGRSKGRVRGLFRRAEPLLANQDDAVLLDAIKQHATCLPADGWPGRLDNNEPKGPFEKFLRGVQQLVFTRDDDAASPYSLECPASDLPADLLEQVRGLRSAFLQLYKAVQSLMQRLSKRLENESELDGDTRRRIEALLKTLRYYVSDQLMGWQNMCEALLASTATPDPLTPTNDSRQDTIDWLAIERIDGRMLDVGMLRRYLDPTKPFITAMQQQAKGMVLTSATLTDPGLETEAGWQAAEAECGTIHLEKAALRASVPSPFDYARQTRVLVVTDVNQKDDTAVANAYQQLFIAAQGGALGLFTAIERLKRVRASIMGALARARLPLYSQHTDGLDPHTLIDIFRAEGNACLLGTDAVRDGVDVPGRALRLIVFDKVPWPRTDLLLKARKAALGGTAYVERITRYKLRQAFGRLIRRADDHGVFILLSPLPSRLASAFPGVTVERVTLAQALEITHSFLQRDQIST